MEARHRARVITVSDRAATGVREDAAGPAVAELLEGFGYELGTPVIVPDERGRIEPALRDAAARDVALVVTTGGTGLSPRDVTPEATVAVCDRLVPGIGEAMRAASARITPNAWLSRAQAGTIGRTLVVNLPGSPKAACENLEAVLGIIGHALNMLRGGTADCAATSDTVASLRPCVLFDFDGTLADTKPAIVACATAVLREWGMDDEQMGDVGRLVGPPFPVAFTQVYGMSEEDAAEVARRYRARFSTMGKATHALFPGMRELLQELRDAGRRLCVTTSKLQRIVEPMLAEEGIADLFDAVVAQSDPSRADKASLVADSVRALAVTPADCVMVGDRFYDVEGAAASGVPCVGVTFGHTSAPDELERAGACAVASSVSALRRILLG